MDRLSDGERDLPAGDVGNLLPFADQMHLDAFAIAVVDRAMAEGIEVEVGIELAVDPGKQIEVESGGYSSRVVVGGKEDRRVFLKVETRPPPGPTVDAISRSTARAASGRKLPIVEPGK
jgi:hypothetical protein